GVPVSAPGDLRGGDASVNAAAARAVFAGEEGPVREAVLLNAGAALAAYDEALGADATDLHAAVARGRERAAAAVDAGHAEALLARWATAAARLRG
ncbi:anthranilate phosphoribosyltransferase, partial [Corallococcus terminator]